MSHRIPLPDHELIRWFFSHPGAVPQADQLW